MKIYKVLMIGVVFLTVSGWSVYADEPSATGETSVNCPGGATTVSSGDHEVGGAEAATGSHGAADVAR